MEIKKENKFKRFIKRYGVLSVACIFAVAIACVVALNLKPTEENKPTSTGVMSFSVPMENAVIVKDFADDRLQHNSTLERWEIHLAVDLTSENNNVFSVCDGIVASIESNSLEGCIVTIKHDDGFVSVYSSLNDDVLVKEGDKVAKGQKIGQASDSASNEVNTGSHLHFVLMKDGLEVDPNNYLDLQNK